MAFELTNLVWASRARLSAMEKLVLVRVADRVNQEAYKRGVPETFVGVQSLADDCELTKLGVLGILDRLIERGFLSVVRESAGKRPRSYRVNLDRLSSGQPGLPQEGAIPVVNRVELVVNPVELVVNGVQGSGQPGLPISGVSEDQSEESAENPREKRAGRSLNREDEKYKERSRRLYRCLECSWIGHDQQVAAHYRQTRHDIRCEIGALALEVAQSA